VNPSIRPAKSQALSAKIGMSVAATAIGAGIGAWWLWAPTADKARSAGTTGPSAALQTGPVTLVVSGDTAGWIVPCGCTSNQSGGLLRRASFVAGLRRQGSAIAVDAGGAPGGVTAYHRARFEAILDGELLMRIAAHNVGEPEAALGVDYLRKQAGERNVPFISANLRDAAGSLVVEPYRVVEAGGVRVALIGVLRAYGTGPGHSGWRVDDPRDAVLKALADAAGKFDRAVVLAYLRDGDLRELAAALPEVDAVIGGPTGQSLAPERAGRVVLASATNKGKFLITVPLTADGSDPFPGAKVVEMSDRFEDDPLQTANLTAFRKELARRDFEAAETGLARQFGEKLPPEYKVAGSKACADCHAAEFATWSESGHADAWQTLVASGVEADPFCQTCHTTGYGLPDGFQSLARSQTRVAVGCESCHGPSQAHVDRPARRTPFAGRDQCTRCHDHENSPQFVFEAYWSRIEHGREEGN
jgi:hypothetical protein